MEEWANIKLQICSFPKTYTEAFKLWNLGYERAYSVDRRIANVVASVEI